MAENNYADYVKKVKEILSSKHKVELDVATIDLVVQETLSLVTQEYFTAAIQQPEEPPTPQEPEEPPAPPEPPKPPSKNVTDKLEVLDTPFKDRPAYVRNVWDMHKYDNKVYFGYGNASNYGPAGAVNGGPVKPFYYDPATKSFSAQKIVVMSKQGGRTALTKDYIEEEQVDNFKVFGGKLYIPGTDSKGGPAEGNIFKLNDGVWEQYPFVPYAGVSHLYDVEIFNGRMFAAIGQSALVMHSLDNGLNWAVTGFTPYGGRVYTFFRLDGKLHAVGAWFMDKTDKTRYKEKVELLSITPDFKAVSTAFPMDNMMPGYKSQGFSNMVRMIRVNYFKDKLLYIFGEVYNDHQVKPQGMVVATSVNNTSRVIFPEENVIPTDIIVRENEVFALTYQKVSKTEYKNVVYRSKDLETWSELINFTQETYANSFEELNNEFYFGLGTDATDVSPASGRILKVDGTPFLSE